MGRQVVTSLDARWIASLKNGRDDWAQMAEAARGLYLAGQEIDWRAFDAPYRRERIALPTYPFDRQRYWFESPSLPASPPEPAAWAPGPARHPFLGRRVPSPLQEVQFESSVSAISPDYLAGHVVFGQTVLPAVVCVEAVLAAARELSWNGPAALEDVSYHEPLVFEGQERCTLQVLIKQGGPDHATFQVFSLPRSDQSGAATGAAWRLHAAGALHWTTEPVGRDSAADEPLADVRRRCDGAIDIHEYDERLSRAGFEYSRAFRSLEAVWGGVGEALGLARLATSDAATAGDYVLHPGLLDACLQVLGVAVQGHDDGGGRSDAYLPTGFERVQIWKAGVRSLWSRARVRRNTEPGDEVLVADVDLWTESGEHAGRIDGLLLKRATLETLRRAANRRRVHEWFYADRWIASEREVSPAPGAIRTWVVFGAGDAVTAELADRLRTEGDRVNVVVGGDEAEWARVHGAVEVDPVCGDGFDRVLAPTAGEPSSSALGVVYLWRFGEMPGVDTGERAGKICRGALQVVQALARRSASAPARLWLVTCGAQSTGGETARAAIEQAPLLGFARSVALEHPALGCMRVDLDPLMGSSAVDALVGELRAGDGEDEVTWRRGTRWVRRLQRVNARTATDRRSLSANATYLVTGGLGGLGQVVARWLVSRGARHLLLLGRHDHPEIASSLLDDLGRQGARVVVEQCDVGDHAQARTVLEGIGRTMPPLGGIVHAAGTIDDGLVAEQRWASFERVLLPKVAGAWNLHRLTDGQPLEFFVLFSSVASLVGSPGQASYAAANAFLDALARHRHSLGQPAVSINWGPWSGVGMAAGVRQAHQRRWADQGVGFIQEDTGIEALEAILALGAPQIAVLPIDWRHVDTGTAAWMGRPLFAGIRPRGTEASTTDSSTPDWRSALLALAGADRLKAAVAYVCQAAGRVLALDASSLDTRQPLTDLGFDSLMALELRNRMADDLCVTLPLARLLEGPTVEGLGTIVCSLLDHAPDAAEGVAPSSGGRQEIVL